jgi:hypothetical protein
VIKSKSDSCVDYVPVRQKNVHHSDRDRNNQTTISAAVSDYNHTPQSKLGGLSPQEVVYGEKGMYDSDEEIDEEEDFDDRDEARDYSVEIIDGMRYLQYEDKAGQSNRGFLPEGKTGQSNRGRARGIQAGQINRGNSCRGKPGQSNKKGGVTHFTVTLMQTSASSGKEVKEEYVPSRRDDKRPTEDSKSNDENNGRVIKDSCENKIKRTDTSQIKTEPSYQ